MRKIKAALECRRMAFISSQPKFPESFTRIPNRAIRDSSKLDAYDFRVLCCIMSCGETGFPGYDALMKWTGFSRERVWKSLRILEKHNFIQRYKRGRGILYSHWWTSSPDELVSKRRVRYTNRTSSPDELQPVRQTNPIKIQDKELSEKRFADADEIEDGGEEEEFKTPF